MPSDKALQSKNTKYSRENKYLAADFIHDIQRNKEGDPIGHKYGIPFISDKEYRRIISNIATTGRTGD